jgi:catechol 2,3-dioxygenase-like lactoylglutathione lyase family enzyme
VGVVRGINVVSISVPDLDAARAFYRDALGLGEPVHDLPDAGWVEFATGGGSGNLAVVAAQAGRLRGGTASGAPSTGTTVVLDVDDCAAACAALRARGVECGDPQVFPGFVTFADVFDPFGNRLQVCSPAPEVDPAGDAARDAGPAATPT